MSERIDKLIRYLLAAVGVAALFAMFIVAGNDDLDRNGRFGGLLALGAVAGVGWPATALSQPYEARRPLRLRWGKAPRDSRRRATPPVPACGASPNATYRLQVLPTMWALGAAGITAVVLGILGYALAGSAQTNGGLLLYVGCAAATLLAVRSVFRLAVSGRAITFSPGEITLGSAIGYVPPLTIDRASVAAFELDGTGHSTLTITTDAGRRYEIRTDHLVGTELPGSLAAAWPEVPWQETAPS